jgi:alcohol dehydrogenase class IV
MSLSTFSFPTTIIFGAGAVKRLAEELEKKSVKRPLLVVDAGLARTKVFETVRSLIPHCLVFSGVEPNPTEANVLDGAEFFVQNDCDGLVGLGGGSALDAAKAIRLKVNHPLPLADYDDNLDGWKKITPELPPYIAIPTTAGTGSEVGRSTVVTIAATNRKTVIFSPYLIPSPAIVDPELTLDLPAHITAGTGMDALTHNVEAYLARGFHPIADAIALGGAKLANDNLPRVMSEPRDIEARGAMLMSSMMGAIAFQKGLGATHSLAHPLSSEFGMHHGTANAVLLPFVLEFNGEACATRLAELGDRLKVTNLAARVRELNEICAIQPRLREYGIPESSLEMLAAKAMEDGCHLLNPRPCTEQDMLALYREAY